MGPTLTTARARGDGAAHDSTREQLARLLQDAAPFWLDIDSRDPQQHALLAEVFGFHPLAIEDTLNPHTRVKVENYDGYVFVVLRSMRFDPEQGLRVEKLGIKKLCLFLGPQYLVTVHSGSLSNIAAAAERIRQDPGLLENGGPARVAHLISDAVIDAYFPILDRVDDFADRLEHTELTAVDRSTFEEASLMRRLAFAARRSILPQRDIFKALAHEPNPYVPRDVQLYFRDVYDHAQRITESLDAYTELISATTDSFLARSSMRIDYAMKVFSAMATIVMPFFIISEVYSMNVRGIPLSANPFGFWIVVAFEILLSCALLAVLSWRRLV